MNTIDFIERSLNNKKCRSAWDNGVVSYALDLLDILSESIEYSETKPTTKSELERVCLNGATNWDCFSWGGCSLIYDCDIAQRLCTPSELKRTQDGFKRPNKREYWLDVQTRALYQAFRLLESLAF